jgi:hypothetical protein
MGISCTTVARFENEGWAARAFDARKARELLAAAGVEFIAANGSEASVRIRKAG